VISVFNLSIDEMRNEGGLFNKIRGAGLWPDEVDTIA